MGEKENMSDTVTEDQETAEEVVDNIVEDAQEAQEQQEEAQEEKQEEEKVPLSALKKVRKEAQEAKMRADLLDQQMKQFQMGMQQQQPQVDNSHDLLTVGQQQEALYQWKRDILEEAFLEQNPDLVDRIKEELPEILQNPRNKWLADSLTQAPNRLQRAAQILEMFKPKREGVPPPDRKNTPKSPQSVAKTNKLSVADRLMEMSDEELEEWRLSQKRKAR